ncbi:hypothetical protein [Coleofasciculus sp. FACHB-1120]|nr:hypothetical protein [Coleofasciculus sp. FACHB-1120]MBD2740131.1 hypothetical protein [Coleofasciculus sp. FACHB-1120]
MTYLPTGELLIYQGLEDSVKGESLPNSPVGFRAVNPEDSGSVVVGTR